MTAAFVDLERSVLAGHEWPVGLVVGMESEEVEPLAVGRRRAAGRSRSRTGTRCEGASIAGTGRNPCHHADNPRESSEYRDGLAVLAGEDPIVDGAGRRSGDRNLAAANGKNRRAPTPARPHAAGIERLPRIKDASRLVPRFPARDINQFPLENV